MLLSSAHHILPHLVPTMPIHSSITTCRISQNEFKELASEVMRHVFDLRNEFGRFFDEGVYKRELATRMPDVELESAITLTYAGFSKTYFVDVLVNSSGLFEFKAADKIHSRHRGQTLNYLLLLDLAHGKVINVRPEYVEHEFVNCPSRLIDLRSPEIFDHEWDSRVAGADLFRQILMSLIADWGAGLETNLYEEALTYFLGGESNVVVPISVMGKSGFLMKQRMRIVAPSVAFKITALQERFNEFVTHARKLIAHTTLEAMLWANITQKSIKFTTINL